MTEQNERVSRRNRFRELPKSSKLDPKTMEHDSVGGIPSANKHPSTPSLLRLCNVTGCRRLRQTREANTQVETTMPNHRSASSISSHCAYGQKVEANISDEVAFQKQSRMPRLNDTTHHYTRPPAVGTRRRTVALLRSAVRSSK